MMRTTTVVSEYDFIFKIVLIGDSAVGKSNLLLRFTRNQFRLNTQSTIGVEFAYKELLIDGKKVKAQVWDTAGQVRFTTVIPQFYRGSAGALVVFDLTKPDSFENVSKWIEEFHQHTPGEQPVVLVGNKSDLVDERAVTREQATTLAQRFNLSYIETSALNATNVEQAFLVLVTSIYREKMPTPTVAPTKQTPEDRPDLPSIVVPIDPDETIHLPNNRPGSVSRKNGCCVIS